MTVKNEKSRRFSRTSRTVIGLVFFIGIDLPLLILLTFLSLNKLINFLTFSAGALSVSLICLVAATIIADLYAKRKHKISSVAY